jgi:hypothetical protein
MDVGGGGWGLEAGGWQTRWKLGRGGWRLGGSGRLEQEIGCLGKIVSFVDRFSAENDLEARAVRSCFLLILAMIVAPIGRGCVSGKAQTPVSEAPIAFVDSQLHTALDQVLILPKYGAMTGVSTEGGHGPGPGTDSQALAYPFVYRPGAPFRMRQPDSKGIMLGPPGMFFLGRGIAIDGVIVVAAGYKSQWLWSLWERRENMTVEMEPLAAADAATHLDRMKTLLTQSRIRGVDLTDEERYVFSVTRDMDLAVNFDSDDKQIVGDYFSGKYRSHGAAQPLKRLTTTLGNAPSRPWPTTAGW